MLGQVLVVEVIGQDTGDDDHEGDEQLEESREHDTELTLLQALGSEGALHDVLVEAPVEEVGNPETEQVNRPRHDRVVLLAHHVQLAADAVDAVLHGTGIEVPEAVEAIRESVAGGSEGIAGVVSRAGSGINDGLGQGVHATQGRNGVVSHHTAAYDECCAPDQVRPSAGLEAADKHVDRSADGHDDAARGEAEVKVDGNDGGTRIDHRSGGNTDQDEQVDNSHRDTRDAVETLLQELRNGVHTALEEHGQEGESHNDEHDGRQPFITRNGEAQPVRCLAAHAHELLRGNVRRQQGETHQPPAETATGQEVIRRAVPAAFLLLVSSAGLPDAQADDTDDHHAEDNHLPKREGILRGSPCCLLPGRSRGEQHCCA